MSFGWAKNAGLVCLFWGDRAIQFGIRRDLWVWGWTEEWWDGPIVLVGLGPVFLYTYAEEASS